MQVGSKCAGPFLSYEKVSFNLLDRFAVSFDLCDIF